MAVRRPLFYSTISGDLQEVSDADMTWMKRACWEAYVADPSVSLSVVAQDGNLGAIVDDRLTAGAEAPRSATTTPSDAQTPAIQNLPISYSRVDQLTPTYATPADTNSKRFFVYTDANGDNIQAMSLQDMIDTFALPAITDYAASLPLYTVSTSTTPPTGYTLVSETPIFKDTVADIAAFAAGGVPEAIDQPLDDGLYYLHQRDAVTITGVPTPLYIDGVNDLREFSEAEMIATLGDIIKHVARNTTDYRIRYRWDGVGTTLGTEIINHRYNSYLYKTQLVNANDYRAQDVPAGTKVAHSSYYLTQYLV